MWKPVLLGLGASFALAGAALADIPAAAITDLNMRSGPGPEYPVITVIGMSDPVLVNGCIEGSAWCMVSYNGTMGWAYSTYLTTSFGGGQIVLAERPATFVVPTIAFGGPTVSAQAFVGAPTIAPYVAAAPAPAGNVVIASALNPPPAVRTFVLSNPATNVYLNGEVAVGATLPSDITVVPVPQYQYAYVTVNGLPVLVDPMTRRIMYIFRS